MPTAHGEVSTDRADRYLGQLVRHTNQMVTHGVPALRRRDHPGGTPPAMVRVESSDSSATLHTGQGRCTLDATSKGLAITVEADNAGQVEQLQHLITSRLETIGRRDNLTVRWDQPPPTTVHPRRKRRTTIMLIAAAVLAIAAHVAVATAVLQAPQWTSVLADGLLVVIVVKLVLVVVGHRLVRHQRRRSTRHVERST